MEEKKKKKWNLEEERDQGRNLTKREKKNYRVYIYIPINKRWRKTGLYKWKR